MAGLSVPSSSLVGRARLLLSSSKGSQVPQLLLLTQEAEGLNIVQVSACQGKDKPQPALSMQKK